MVGFILVLVVVKTVNHMIFTIKLGNQKKNKD